MAFTRTTHPLVGKEMIYLPQGTSPYQIPLDIDYTKFILVNGDKVTVLSAWTRDYLPPTAPILLYVRSHNTHHYTHITADDLKEI